MRRSAQILIVLAVLLGLSAPMIAAVVPCRCEPMIRGHHDSEHHGAAQESNGSALRSAKCDGMRCCLQLTVAKLQAEARHSCRARSNRSALTFVPAVIQANSSASAACSAFVSSPHFPDPARVPREFSCVLLN